jgi:osmotically-inducible protein OsmY
MYENPRDHFSPRYGDKRDDDRERRWRREEQRYRREAWDDNRFDDDRWDNRRRRGEFGYGQTFRDADYAGYDRYGARREDLGYGPEWRDEGPRYDHRERVRHHDHGYGSSAGYRQSGDSRYFTGQQTGWTVGGPDRAPAYGHGGYGEDYRPHGYDRSPRDEHRGFFDKAGDEIASWFGDDDAARRREMDHRGRGPKGYVRSDERICDDVNDRLTDDWRLDASDISVTVESGEVTLDGTVRDRASKRRAEDLAEDISGVRHVQNNLRVADRGFDERGRNPDDDGLVDDLHATNRSGTARATES